MRINLRFLTLGLAVCFASTAAKADSITVGNPGFTNPVETDGCTDCVFIVNQPFAQAGYTVTSYTFDSNVSNGAAFEVGLFTGVNNGNGTESFTLASASTSIFVTSTGPQTYAYTPIFGSAVTTASTYLGWGELNGAVMQFDYFTDPGNPSVAGTYAFSRDYYNTNNPLTSQNTSFNVDSINDLNNRSYPISATAISPELGTLSLLGTGLLGVGAVVRRRLKK